MESIDVWHIKIHKSQSRINTFKGNRFQFYSPWPDRERESTHCRAKILRTPAITLIIRGSFKIFYLLLHNFVNLKSSRMKLVVIVTLSLSYTFMANQKYCHFNSFFLFMIKLEQRFWTTETGKCHYNKCVDFAH